MTSSPSPTALDSVSDERSPAHKDVQTPAIPAVSALDVETLVEQGPSLAIGPIGTTTAASDAVPGSTLLRTPTSSIITTPGVVRPMIGLAFPVLIQQILIMLVGLVDAFLAGRFLAESHVAAIGVMVYMLWMFPCVFSFVGVGATAIIARTVGAGDGETARKVCNQSVTTGLVLSVAMMMVTFLFGPALMAAMGLEGEALTAANGYLSLLMLFLPAMMVEQIGMACLRGAGDTLSGLIAMAVVNVVNAGVGLALVIGVGPIPALGWLGLAIGTVVGYLVGAIMLSLLLYRGRAGLQWRFREMVPDWPVIRRILRVGIPGGSDMMAIVICQFIFLSMVGSLGQLALAAHSLAIRMESLAYLPGTAFQVAASTMVGQYLGAGEPKRAARSVWLAAGLCGTFVSAMGLVFFFTPETLTGLFTGEQTADAGTTAAGLLKIVALAMPFMGVGMVAAGGLRGAGDVRWPLLFTLLGFLLVRIPLAGYLCWETLKIPGTGATISGMGLGVAGAWWAMFIDLAFRSCLTIGRFLQGGWQRQVV